MSLCLIVVLVSIVSFVRGSPLYSSFSYGLEFSILSPPSLTGVISFIPLGDAPSPPDNITAPIVLPNSHDSVTGCDEHGVPVRFTPIQDNGRSFLNTVLLLQSQGSEPCPFDLTGLPVAGVIQVMSGPFAFVGSDGFSQYSVPVLYPLTAGDMNPIISYLCNSSLSSKVPVVVHIIGSGPLVSEEKEALTTIATKFNYTENWDYNYIFYGPNTSSLYPYPSSPYFDPCLSSSFLQGVYCEDGHIVFIEYEEAGLIGSLPVDFGVFRHVRLLALSQNELVGEVPSWLCEWTDLRYLALAGNAITKLPDCFESMKKLVYVDAHINKIVQFPMSLLKTSATLSHLDLSSNLIEYFPSFASMSALIHLDLSSNNATGTAFSFQELTSVQFIDLHGKYNF